MPTVLTYNLSGERSSRLRLICLRLNLHVRVVSPSEYGLPIGALAGLLPPGGAVPADPFFDEMLVFSGFDSTLLDRFLKAIREEGIPGVALKAVLTPVNMYWNSARLHEEISREHEAMHYASRSRGAGTEKK